LPLLASLEDRSIHEKFDCFLGARDGNSLEGNVLADKATKDGFTLFWKAMARPEVEAFPYF